MVRVYKIWDSEQERYISGHNRSNHFYSSRGGAKRYINYTLNWMRRINPKVDPERYEIKTFELVEVTDE